MVELDSSTLEKAKSKFIGATVDTRSLPAELMAMIFMYCIEEEDEESKEWPCSAEVAVILTHVCHHWRQVALATPQLWQHLRIVSRPKQQPSSLPRPPSPTEGKGWRMITPPKTNAPLSPLVQGWTMNPTAWSSMAREWISRAKRLAVSLKIGRIGSDDVPSLIPLLPRLGHLELIIDEDYQGPVIHEGFTAREPLAKVSTPLPHLHSLDVTTRAFTGWNEWVLSIIESAPQLDSIAWMGTPTIAPPNHIFTDRLRKVWISQPLYFYDIIFIINTCCHAESLKFTVSNLALPDPDELQPNHITLHKLRELWLGYDAKGHSAQLRMLLNHITTPALTSISINSFDWPQRPLFNLLERSGCTIRSLECVQTDIWNCQIVELLQHPSIGDNITSFAVTGRGYCVDDKVLDALGHAGPNLKFVKFTGELNTGRDCWEMMNSTRIQNNLNMLVSQLPLRFQRAVGSMSEQVNNLSGRDRNSDSSIRIFRRLPLRTPVVPASLPFVPLAGANHYPSTSGLSSPTRRAVSALQVQFLDYDSELDLWSPVTDGPFPS